MVDVFSAGVLMLEICTQESPEVQPIGICTIEEVKRRKADLDKLECNHVLRPIILRCLQDKPKDRPSIEELSSTLRRAIEVPEDCPKLTKAMEVHIYVY